MRRAAFALPALAIFATCLAWTVSSSAAGGTGNYATWTQSGTGATGAVAATAFPTIAANVADGTITVARTATVTGSTPFGTVYGTSNGSTYLSNGMAAGKSESVTTMTFSAATPIGTWGFALGDIDAESVSITASNAAGQPVSTANWFQSAFNYAGAADVPAWNSATSTLVGNGVDTSGASGWFKPTEAVKTITLTQRKLSGFPSYQLWLATDTQPIATATPSASATARPTATPTPSTSVRPAASGSATPSATALCKSTDTALVNGDFEEPAIPPNSYRQLLDSAVPGWSTTASDHKIEIWSSGFNGVTSPQGAQFAELNATQDSELYQEVTTVPGQELKWSLYHRARGAGASGDTMSVNIGAPGRTPDSVTKFTDNLTEGWVLHTGTYVVPAGQTSTRFGFESGPTASGSKSVGNFLDHIFFTRAACLPAEATKPPVNPVATATPTASPTVKPSATSTAGPTPSASASSSTTPGASVTPTASSFPTAGVTPSTSPSSGRPATSSPGPANPSSPPTNSTVIDVATVPGVTPGSTVSEVKPPAHGTARIVDSQTIIYTPDPGYTGKDQVTIVVKDRQGNSVTVQQTVTAARAQSVVNWTMPTSLHSGTNVIASRALMTNAGQAADLIVTCRPITRSKATDTMQDCQVARNGARFTVWIAPGSQVAVKISVSAPAKGGFTALDQSTTIIVR